MEAEKFKWCSNGSKGPKVCQEYVYNIPIIRPQLIHWSKAGHDAGFLVVCTKFWPYCKNTAAEIKMHHARQHFSPVFVRVFVNCSLSFLLADRSGTTYDLLLLEFICFKSAAYIGYNQWLYKLLLLFNQLTADWSFSSDLWHQQAAHSL